MTEQPEDRAFERWAMAGACALALVGIAAFLVRREPPDVVNASQDAAGDGVPADGQAGSAAGDLVRIRIGGERPPAPLPDPVRDRGDKVYDANLNPGTGDDVPPAPDDSTSTTPSPEPAVRTVIVQSGETLSQIAQRELGTVRRLPELLEMNGIDDPNAVRTGATLKLPPR